MSYQIAILNLPARPPALLDSQLAELFGVELKRINEAQKRNKFRFPDDFAFQLSKQEVKTLWSQIATEQFTIKYRIRSPWAYTEEGVAMLASILTTPQAVAASVRALRLFRETRKALFVSRVELDALKRENKLLKLTAAPENPIWKKIERYKKMGLNHTEVAKLLNVTPCHIGKQIRKLELLGRLDPPANLGKMQRMIENTVVLPPAYNRRFVL